MRAIILKSGKRFGLWTVLHRTEPIGDKRLWLCRCDCGIRRPVAASDLRSGKSISCGCIKRRKALAARNVPLPPVVVGARWIPLSKGQFALVDDADYERLNSYLWVADEKSGGGYYACRNSDYDVNGKRSKIFMHVEILRPPFGRETDHQDADGLNNRRQNLRVATGSQNCCNRRIHGKSSGGFKGVYKRSDGRFIASIKKNGRSKHIGVFRTAVNAATAYNLVALELHGEFARFNP